MPDLLPLLHRSPLNALQHTAPTALRHPAESAVATLSKAHQLSQDVFAAGQPVVVPFPMPTLPGMRPPQPPTRIEARLHQPGYANTIDFKGPLDEASGKKLLDHLHEAWQGYLKPDGSVDKDRLAKEPLHFLIHSPGGEVSSAMQITKTMDWLKEQGLTIVTHAYHQAQSAAAVILAHGSHRVVSPATNLGLHGIQLQLSGMFPLSSLKQNLHHPIELNRAFLKGFYDKLSPEAPKRPATYEAFAKQLEHDWMLNAREAKAIGLVDEVDGFFHDFRPKPPEAEKTPPAPASSTTTPLAPEPGPLPVEPIPAPEVVPEPEPLPVVVPPAIDSQPVPVPAA